MTTLTNLERAIDSVLHARQPLTAPAVFDAYCCAAGYPFASVSEADREPELLRAAVCAFERAIDKSAAGRAHAAAVERIASEYWRQKHGGDWERCKDCGCACRTQYVKVKAHQLVNLGPSPPEGQQCAPVGPKPKGKKRVVKRKVKRVVADPFGPSTSSIRA